LELTGEKKTYFLGGKHKGNGSLGRPRCSSEDNIKIIFIEIGWKGTEWLGLFHD
jgi:hypothetical protein